jgi:hypothetical protein
MRRVVLTGMVALLAGVVAWLCLRSWKSHGPERALDPTADEVVDTRSSPMLDAAESPAQRGVIAPTPDEPTESAPVSRQESAEAYLQATGQIRLRGTVVVLDEHKVEHRAEDGTFQLGLLTDHSGSVVDVKVVAGRFELDVGPCEELSLDRASFAERTAFACARHVPIPMPADHVVEFCFRWPPAIVLHVRDAVSGSDLSGVEAVLSGSWETEELLVPEIDAKALHGHSPLAIRVEDIPEHTWVSSVFVRADGYAWSHVKCDPTAGGDVFAELQPACSLDVEIEGDKSTEGLRLRLTGKDQYRPLLDMALGTQARRTFESLPPGEFELSAQIGEWYREPVSLAKSPVTLVAGARSVARLVIARPPSAVTADLSGVLLMPAAWGSQPGTLSVERLGASSMPSTERSVHLDPAGRRDGLDVYDWRLAKAEVGKYELSLYEPSFAFVVELLPGGTSGVRIEIPPPADVSIRVVDAATNADVVVDDVNWHTKRPEESRGWTDSSAKRNAVTGRYEARCPIGDVEFSVFPIELGYDHVSTTALIRPGGNEVLLALSRANGVRLVLKDGDQDLPLDSDREFVVEPVTGTGRVASWSWGAAGTRLHVTEPGKYRIRLKDPIAGYLMPKEEVVDIQPGSVKDVLIRLTRKP